MTVMWEREFTARTTPDTVQDAFWYFAAERLRMYLRRVSGDATPPPDSILRTYRFTNSYRACDRVSQYLIRRVQYHHDQHPDEVVFRTLLFKLFNKIETWEVLAGESVPTVADFAPDELASRLTERACAGHALYSAAYIVPPVIACPRPKHLGHLRLLGQMLDDDLPGKVRASGGLEEVFWLLRSYSGIGDFLAFQFAVDISYSAAVPFDDSGFVVAGPGSVDGVSKYAPNSSKAAAVEVINRCCDEQEVEFSRRGIDFQGLFGRRLQPIDVQNLFCELSKYSRVAFPDVAGVAGRTRIKQRYVPAGNLPAPFFPPKWGLTCAPSSEVHELQGARVHVRHDSAASMFPELMEDAVTREDGRLPLRA
jgi:hypothetical protein